MIQSIVQSFLDYLRDQDRSQATLRAYRSDLSGFATWFEQTNSKAMSPAEVTALDVREFKSYLQTTQKQKPATVNRKLASLKTFFGWAIERSLAPVDPTAGIKPVRQTKTAPRWLERKEQRDLIRELDVAIQTARTDPARIRAHRDRAILALMMNAGLRIGEVSELTTDNLTLNSRSGSVDVQGKGNKHRTVPLNASARKAIQAWLDVRDELDEAEETPYVFLSPKGTNLKPNSIYERVTFYARRAGISDMSPHTLRHTCAKNLTDRGVSLDRVAAVLGHESLDTTAIYTQPSQVDLEREMEKIAWEE